MQIERESMHQQQRYRVWQQGLSQFYTEHCIYLPAMLGWFASSLCLTALNKIVFGKERLAFPCPLLMTSIHFLAQWTFSFIACELCPGTMGGERVKAMSWKEFLLVSVPCGMITSGDIGLSNLSIAFITVTFYTMVKASTPIFVLAWGYMFGIVDVTWYLLGVVLVIAFGEFLTVVGEVEFVLKGFLLCLVGSFLSGARWTMVQLQIQSLDPPLKTPIETMRLLAPFMFLTMLAVSCAIEQPWIKLHDWANSTENVMSIFGLGVLGGFFAIMLILCEFYLIMHTNAVILMIGGVIKEMLAITIGVSFFGDQLNRINVTGCLVVFIGVILYKITFHCKKEGDEETEQTYAKVLPAEELTDDETESTQIEMTDSKSPKKSNV